MHTPVAVMDSKKKPALSNNATTGKYATEEAAKLAFISHVNESHGTQGAGNSCANTVAGVETKTVGWKPRCSCVTATRPCVALDPLAGSGTTLAVAKALGRTGWGIELNAEYVELAQVRVSREGHK